MSSEAKLKKVTKHIPKANIPSVEERATVIRVNEFSQAWKNETVRPDVDLCFE